MNAPDKYRLLWNHTKPSSGAIAGAICTAEYARPYEAPDDKNTAFPVIIGLWDKGVTEIKHRNDNGFPYAFIDTAYVRPSFQSPYHRIALNRLHTSKIFPQWNTRWEELGVRIEPWRRGEHILLVMQSNEWNNYFHEDTGALITKTVRQIRKYTDRPILVRIKPSKVQRNEILRTGYGSLSNDFNRAHAVVSYSSSAMAEAALAGIPVFPLATCASSAIGNQLKYIESPVYYDNREQWIASLAMQQWTIDEIRSGRAFRDLWEQHATYPIHGTLQ